MYQKHVVPSYGRFEVVLSRGAGSYVWDVTGKRYLDLGAGIAVCALGHAHPEITETLIEQSRQLVHVSNLYYTEPQGRLAQALAERIGPGKCFFGNSGAEANEGLFKLARKFGHDQGRFEIVTATNSFHGRTLAGIAATGQDKVKKGFEPMVAGFRHVPYNDLEAVRAALTPATVAVLIEGIQGEGGITPASPDYLLGLRRFCDEKDLLLFMDEVQCGYFRSGRFLSYQRILEDRAEGATFLPDGVSLAKSIGNGFPLGAFWVRQPHADLLGPGTHASTYGGTPLACAVALKVLEVVRRDQLADHARAVGEFLRAELSRLARQYPAVLHAVRGLGLMLGIELAPDIPGFRSPNGKVASLRFVERLHQAGVLTIPAGTNVIRLLPPLNLTRAEAAEGIGRLEPVVRDLAAG
ncbi:MAG: aspartate aminotransferase family protein [Verrucomicrobia bacterium]|nr:aspartate aminotransferase family protein [Verrucomicrobiota bacterium]